MKRLLLFTILSLFFGVNSAQAQTNIALTAKAAHSGGGAAAFGFGPNNYNDNRFGACTSTCTACSIGPWGWVTSGAAQWIEYTWTSPQAFDKVVFYKSNRPLTQTMLQYWNGSAYVDIIKYNSTVCAADSIFFPMVTSTKLRFYGMGTSSNPNFREIQVYNNVKPCNGMPEAGTLNSSVSSGSYVCQDSLIMLNVSGAAISKLKDIKYQWMRRPIGSTGAWSPIIGATDTLYAADSIAGWEIAMTTICLKTLDTAYTTSVNFPTLASPSVLLSPPSPISFCVGDTVWLNATKYPGALYTWYKDGVEVLGWMHFDIGVTEAGKYLVKVQNGDPCPGYSKPLIINANDPGYSVSIAAPSDSFICAGTSLLLTGIGSKSGLTYQWSKNNVPIVGAVSNSYLVSASGYYRVEAFDGVSKCPAISRNIKIIVKDNPPAVITIPGGTTTACENEGVTLNINSGSYDYDWYRNGLTVFGMSDSSHVIKNSGIYRVKVRSADGCFTISAPISITILPSPIPVITRLGMALSTVDTYVFYKWVRNTYDTLAATTSSITIIKKGYYKVIVEDINGCLGESAPIEAMDESLAIDNSILADNQIRLYPNPTNGIVTIESPTNLGVEVKDVTGKTILNKSKTHQVDLSQFADGVYIFILTDNGKLVGQHRVSKFSANK